MYLPKELFLVRHGEILTRKEREILKAIRHGELNPGISLSQGIPAEKGLTPFGVEQVALVAAWLRKSCPSMFAKANDSTKYQFWVGPYDPTNARCHKTNAHLGVHPDLWKVSPLLKDREWGGDGRLIVRDALRQQQKDSVDPFNWRPSGCGTSTADLVAKAREFLESLRRPRPLEAAVVSCHGEVIIAFQAAIRNLRPEEFNIQLRDLQFEMPAAVIAHFLRSEIEAGESNTDNYSRDRLICPWDRGYSRDNGKWLYYE